MINLEEIVVDWDLLDTDSKYLLDLVDDLVDARRRHQFTEWNTSIRNSSIFLDYDPIARKVELQQILSGVSDGFWCTVCSDAVCCQAGKYAGDVRLLLPCAGTNCAAKDFFLKGKSAGSSSTLRGDKLELPHNVFPKYPSCESTDTKGGTILNSDVNLTHKKLCFENSNDPPPNYTDYIYKQANSRDPTQLIPSSTTNLYNTNNNLVDGDGGQAIDDEAFIQQTDETKIDENEAINHKMAVGMLPQNRVEVSIDIPPEEIKAELTRTSEIMKLTVDNIREPVILDKVCDLVLSTSAQGAVSLMSAAGSPTVPWIIVGANGIAFTTSLISMCIRAKKPPVSSVLAKVGIGALVTTVMGVTYMYLPVYVKWLAGFGCAIPIDGS